MTCELCNDKGYYKVCIAEVDGEEIIKKEKCVCKPEYTREDMKADLGDLLYHKKAEEEE